MENEWYTKNLIGGEHFEETRAKLQEYKGKMLLQIKNFGKINYVVIEGHPDIDDMEKRFSDLSCLFGEI